MWAPFDSGVGSRAKLPTRDQSRARCGESVVACRVDPLGKHPPNSARISSASGEAEGRAALVGISRARAKQTGVSASSSRILR